MKNIHTVKSLVWFREDLRIQDNTALYHAVKNYGESVIAVYIIDKKMWAAHDIADCRIKFIYDSLKSLETELNALNIPLIVLEVMNSDELIPQLDELITRHQVNALFFNRQYEINEQRRDEEVETYFVKKNKIVKAYHDQTILSPGSVRTKEGGYFKVFTAYKNAWRKCFLQNEQFDLLSLATTHKTLTEIPPNQNLWPASHNEAAKRLNHFIETNLFSYDQTRDFPALNQTSRLSPYLAAGLISPRQCFLAAFKANHYQLDTGNEGAITWMSELIWRDFYKHILVAVPRVSMHRAYQLPTEKIQWKTNPAHLKAWQEGHTGIPIIDAAMRQLNQIGWMHNRLRMVTAMFFTKNLFLDWRIGEKYFMNRLIDGDLAANNGGWQWCASTGTDAAPYFRVFNPISQSERFDPKGEFIRQYCPELATLDDHAIHDPYHRASLLMNTINYPQPLVDLKSTRQYAIQQFKNL